MNSGDHKYLIFHGRFQPLHMGHFHVLKHAIENNSEKIIIGVINPDPHEIWQSDDPKFQRFHPDLNPLSYWERLLCIKAMIQEYGFNHRIFSITPLPRPSINSEKCSRFVPINEARFLLSIRYGDEIEEWKRTTYEEQGLVTSVIYDSDLDVDVSPISAGLIRDLMVAGFDDWRSLVPSSTLSILLNPAVYAKMTAGKDQSDALYRLKKTMLITPYKDWYKNNIPSVYRLTKNNGKNMKSGKSTGLKPADVGGAIMASVCGVFPFLQGFLRLYDQKQQQNTEANLLEAIKDQHDQTVSDIKEAILKHNPYGFYEGTSFVDELAVSLQSYIKGNSFSFNTTRNREEYINALVDAYDMNIDDLWILVRDYGFDPSRIKGTTARSKIRNFMQLLSHHPRDEIKGIIGAIRNEYPSTPIFDEAYRLLVNMERNTN